MTADPNYRHTLWPREGTLHSANTDILLLVEGQFFPAHRSILAANSGYFKSLLETDEDHHRHLVQPLTLPGLPAPAFALLLDFMYSGRLDVSMFNIYHVLLCAQFLHMTEAVELCRFFLLQEQQRQFYVGIRPGADNNNDEDFLSQGGATSRLFPFRSFFPYAFLSGDDVPPDKSKDQRVLRPIPQKVTVMTSNNSIPENCVMQPPNSESSKTSRPNRLKNSEFYIKNKRSSTSSLGNNDTNQCSRSFENTDSDFLETNMARPSLLSTKNATLTPAQNASQFTAPNNFFNLNSEQKAALLVKMNKSNTIVDIACCDGPVHFQRVINENYRLGTLLLERNARNDEDSNQLVLDHSKSKTKPHYNLNFKCHFQAASALQETHKNNPNDSSTTSKNCSNFGLEAVRLEVASSTTENISSQQTHQNASLQQSIDDGRAQSPEYSEESNWENSDYESEKSYIEQTHGTKGKNKKTDATSQSSSDSFGCSKESIVVASLSVPSSLETNSFKCFYCKHSFKSHYCFQKHKKRHINPVSYDEQGVQSLAKEFQPLDRNVPFYPCKTCGSKFPSYYFVHKHRKNCHLQRKKSTD